MLRTHAGKRHRTIRHIIPEGKSGFIPYIVFVVLVAIILLLSWLAKHQYELVTKHRTLLTTQQVAIRLETLLNSQFILVQQQERMWLRSATPSEEDFRNNAQLIQEQFKYLKALNWITPDGIIKWVIPVSGNEAVIDYDLSKRPDILPILIKAKHTGTPQTTPPIEIVQGGKGFVTYFPALSGNKLKGYYSAVFQIKPFLKHAFGDEIWNNYNVLIRDGDQTVYQTPHHKGFSDDATGYKLNVLNRSWTLFLSYKPSSIYSLQSLTEYLALVIAIFFAASLSYLLKQYLIRQERLTHSESRYHALFENTPIAILEQDYSKILVHLEQLRSQGIKSLEDYLENHPTTVRTLAQKVENFSLNRAAIKLYGAESQGELEAKRPGAISTPALREFAQLLNAIWRGDRFFSAQITISSFDYKEILVELSMPVPDQDMQGAIVPVCMLDMTDHVKAGQAMQEAKERAISADKAKSEFLANMSHELRTPLNAILGFADLIRNQMHGPMNQPKYLEYAEDIQKSGTLLLNIINSILDLSKIEAGRYELNPEPVEIDYLLESVIRIVRGHAREKNITIKTDFSSHLPAIIVDERAILQVLLNLLTNALKFTRENGTVVISAGISPDDLVTVEVQDNGIGIDKKDMERVLTPFVQAESNLARRFDGTGLGLPLAKLLIELHGGTLELESEFGKWTKVRFHLPRNYSGHHGNNEEVA